MDRAKRDDSSALAPAAQQHAPDQDAGDDEPMGGDPACWLHLIEDDQDDAPVTPEQSLPLPTRRPQQ